MSEPATPDPKDLNRDYREAFPGVFLPKSDPDPVATLRRLFPQSHYPALWQRHAGAFGVSR